MRVGSLFLPGEAEDEGEEEAGDDGEEEAGDEEEEEAEDEGEGEAMTGGGTAGSRRPPLGDY